MQTGPPPRETAIDEALAHCVRQAEQEGISLDETLERLGPASFCFVCLLISVLFIQPLSLGPLTIASGLTFIAAGWQMTRGRSVPLLPAAMRKTHIHGKFWLATLHFCQRTLVFCRKFTRPRLHGWVAGKTGEKVVGWFILLGGVLLAVPMANLPFNNTFPALMVLFAAIAWLERDGLMLIVSLLCGVLALAYFLIAAKVAWFLILQFFHWMKPFWPPANF